MLGESFNAKDGKLWPENLGLQVEKRQITCLLSSVLASFDCNTFIEECFVWDVASGDWCSKNCHMIDGKRKIAYGVNIPPRMSFCEIDQSI